MEEKDLKAIVLEQGQVFEEFKSNHAKQLEDVKKFGHDGLSETKEKAEKLNARLDDIDKKLNERVDAIEVAAKRPRSAGADVATKSAAFRATEKWLRFGLKANAAVDLMDAEEKAAFGEMRTKSLNSQTDQGGGFLVPEDFQAEVIKKIANLANVGSMVSRITTGRDAVRWPKVTYTTDNKYTSSLAVTWEDQIDSATSTDPSPFGSVLIETKKARSLVKISRELLEDSAVDVTALVSQLAGENYAVEEDKVFSVGSGGKTPEGFMTNTDISTTNSGTSAALNFIVAGFPTKGIIAMVYALPSQYAQNAAFMTSRANMGLIRQLVDGTGRFLWEPSTQVGSPSTLLGYPLHPNEHITAVAAASRSLIFADFKQLYRVVEKNSMSVQRLDEKYADTDEVGFIFRRRVGGAVVAPWAAQILVCSA